MLSIATILTEYLNMDLNMVLERVNFVIEAVNSSSMSVLTRLNSSALPRVDAFPSECLRFLLLKVANTTPDSCSLLHLSYVV